jgi:hypothetical protein
MTPNLWPLFGLWQSQPQTGATVVGFADCRSMFVQ